MFGDHAAEYPISLPRVAGAFTSYMNTHEMTKDDKCNQQFVELSGHTNGSTDNEDAKRFAIRQETMHKIKSITGHVGLLIALMLYTVIGGLVSLKIKKGGRRENMLHQE